MISLRKFFFNVVGCICVGLAFLGLFLPLLPTTPFLLLAAYCFSRGSARLHAWLLHQPTLGSIIRDWNEKRVIRPRVKAAAVVTTILILSPALIFGSFHPALKGFSIVVGLVVIVMIYRQPS
jgi:uncharacterized membrane protein YbaN (DUF454 family)